MSAFAQWDWGGGGGQWGGGGGGGFNFGGEGSGNSGNIGDYQKKADIDYVGMVLGFSVANTRLLFQKPTTTLGLLKRMTVLPTLMPLFSVTLTTISKFAIFSPPSYPKVD